MCLVQEQSLLEIGKHSTHSERSLFLLFSLPFVTNGMVLEQALPSTADLVASELAPPQSSLRKATPSSSSGAPSMGPQKVCATV